MAYLGDWDSFVLYVAFVFGGDIEVISDLLQDTEDTTPQEHDTPTITIQDTLL